MYKEAVRGGVREHGRTHRTSSSCVFPSDLDNIVIAWQVLLGPRTGLPVKCDSRVMRLASKHRSSMDSPRLGDGPSGGGAAGLPDDSADMIRPGMPGAVV